MDWTGPEESIVLVVVVFCRNSDGAGATTGAEQASRASDDGWACVFGEGTPNAS